MIPSTTNTPFASTGAKHERGRLACLYSALAVAALCVACQPKAAHRAGPHRANVVVPQMKAIVPCHPTDSIGLIIEKKTRRDLHFRLAKFKYINLRNYGSRTFDMRTLLKFQARLLHSSRARHFSIKRNDQRLKIKPRVRIEGIYRLVKRLPETLSVDELREIRLGLSPPRPGDHGLDYGACISYRQEIRGPQAKVRKYIKEMDKYVTRNPKWKLYVDRTAYFHDSGFTISFFTISPDPMFPPPKYYSMWKIAKRRSGDPHWPGYDFKHAVMINYLLSLQKYRSTGRL